ncbi:MAG: hypothetical protein ACLFV8_13960, partial [Alphaproteobacteria bacterium]
SELSSRQTEDFNAVESIIKLANAHSKIERRVVYFIFYGLVFIVATAPLLFELIGGWWRYFPLLVSVPLVSYMMVSQFRGRPTDLDVILDRRARKKMMFLAERRGIERKLSRFQVEWNPTKKKFEVSPIEIDNEDGDLFGS